MCYFKFLTFRGGGGDIPDEYPTDFSKFLYKLSPNTVFCHKHKVFQTLLPPHNSLSKQSLTKIQSNTAQVAETKICLSQLAKHTKTLEYNSSAPNIRST